MTPSRHRSADERPDKPKKKSISIIFNKEFTKVTVLQTDDTMDPTMEEAEEGSEPEANSEVTI